MPRNLRDAHLWSDAAAQALGTPLQPSVVYRAASPDALDAQYEQGIGFTYSREGHPNAQSLASRIDRLEGGQGGLMTASGMAAVTATMLGLCQAGDHVLGGDQLYGRCLRLLNVDLPRFGIATSLADPTDIAAMKAALRPETKLIVIEIVSNPTLRVADLDGIVALAQAHGALLVVDNTFTTPLAIRPFEHGADVVIHSVTKLLAGHSDAMLGYVAARAQPHAQVIEDVIVTMGLTPSPYDCWMAERGLLSFELRYARASDTAAQLADAIATHPAVAHVLYPGRGDHPDHNRAGQLLAGPGNMVSFTLSGGRAAANALVAAMPEVAFAPTLGDIGTTLSHPASSSHRGLSAQARAEIGISEGMFRVSVGIEPVETLLAQVAAGLDAAAAA